MTINSNCPLPVLHGLTYDKKRFYELLNAHAVIAGRCNSQNPELSFGEMTVDELLNHLMPNGIRFSIHNIEREKYIGGCMAD